MSGPNKNRLVESRLNRLWVGFIKPTRKTTNKKSIKSGAFALETRRFIKVVVIVKPERQLLLHILKKQLSYGIICKNMSA